MDVGAANSFRINEVKHTISPPRGVKSSEKPKIEECFQKSTAEVENVHLINREVAAKGVESGAKTEKSQALPFNPQWENRTKANGEKELTILFYLNGQYTNAGGNKEKAQFLINLEKTGSTKDINVAAQLGRAPDKQNDINSLYYCTLKVDNDWAGIRRYEVKQDDHKELPVYNMEKYLQLEKELPQNPLLLDNIGILYRNQGQSELAEVYKNKAIEAGISDVLNHPETPKNQKIIEEFNTNEEKMLKPLSEKMTFKSTMVEELPEGSKMKNPETLKDAIKWGMKKYPAKHFMVVMGAHGGAWSGASDMKPKEIRDAIKSGVAEANEETGRDDHIDGLVFNACYMSNLEALNEMRDVADITVASENSSRDGVGEFWPAFIDYIQKNIDKNKSFDAEKFSYVMVDTYRKDSKNIKETTPPDIARIFTKSVTLTAVKNEKIGAVVESWKKFNQICKKEGVTDEQLFTALSNAKNYPSKAYSSTGDHGIYSGLRDIGSLMDEFKKIDDVPTSAKKAAENVKIAVKNAIINEQHEGIGMEGSSGLSVWAPNTFANTIPNWNNYVDDTPGFLKKSEWMIDRIYKTASKINEEKIWKSFAKQTAIKTMINLQKLKETAKKDLKEIGNLTKEEMDLFCKLSKERNKHLKSMDESSLASDKERQILKALKNMTDKDRDHVNDINLIYLDDNRREFLKAQMGLTEEQSKNLHTIVDLNDDQKKKLEKDGDIWREYRLKCQGWEFGTEMPQEP